MALGKLEVRVSMEKLGYLEGWTVPFISRTTFSALFGFSHVQYLQRC
jgi:hypothetical protein